MKSAQAPPQRSKPKKSAFQRIDSSANAAGMYRGISSAGRAGGSPEILVDIVLNVKVVKYQINRDVPDLHEYPNWLTEVDRAPGQSIELYPMVMIQNTTDQCKHFLQGSYLFL